MTVVLEMDRECWSLVRVGGMPLAVALADGRWVVAGRVGAFARGSFDDAVLAAVRAASRRSSRPLAG